MAAKKKTTSRPKKKSATAHRRGAEGRAKEMSTGGGKTPSKTAETSKRRAQPNAKPRNATKSSEARRKCKALRVLKNAAGSVDVAPVIRIALALEPPTVVSQIASRLADRQCSEEGPRPGPRCR